MRYTDDQNKRLIKRISERSGVGERTTGKVIRALSEYIEQALLEGEGVQLVPIGKLESRIIQAHTTNLPDKDGSKKKSKRQRRVKFYPSNQLKERLILDEK